jgi:phosphonate transport system substrate-binding protein
MVLFGWAALACPLAGEAPAALLHFRLAVSEGVIGAEVNESDATAAIQAWSNAVVKETGFQVEVHVAGKAAMAREVREHQVDGFTVTTLELLDLESYAAQKMVADTVNAAGGDDYLILVHADSGIRDVSGLRRKTVGLYDSREMSLAGMWIETLLFSSNFGLPRDYFGRIASSNKLSRVVLPVYFHQTDACIVTRRGFSMMCELNPQLGRSLRIVASSPKLVSSVLAFHKDCPPEQRQQFIDAIIRLNKTAAGKQALTLFASTQLVAADASILRTTLDLVKAHRQALKIAARK